MVFCEIKKFHDELHVKLEAWDGNYGAQADDNCCRAGKSIYKHQVRFIFWDESLADHASIFTRQVMKKNQQSAQTLTACSYYDH